MSLYFRYIMFFSGLTLFGLGIAIAIQVKHLGLHPWDVLSVALYDHFGVSIGFWGVVVGLLLIGVSSITARKYISIGTFLNALFIGPIIDFFLWLDILPSASGTWTDYLVILCGIILTGIGGGMYVAAGIGAGPRDGFMLSISEKTGMSISNARILVESAVLLIGLLLGGPVFVMSFIYTLIQSPVFQKSLLFFRKVSPPQNAKKAA
ncbi:putative membrane protein YczE [Peribacillus deserti]|uniref:Membrane protein YczE n=1 Tax=Peribacillus deserti TaxID=673318 RepID=A0ABS2QL74_9BACI|nr:YitT family protein [Peribacillus deserti]MBM7693469.1 putative membrane protein YczE [Peribacillus deserti]